MSKTKNPFLFSKSIIEYCDSDYDLNNVFIVVQFFQGNLA